MSEREDMNDRIKAAQTALPPPAKPVKVREDEVYTFQCRIGEHAAIYQPWNVPGINDSRSTYGILTDATYVPAFLRDYVRPPKPDKPYVAIGGGKMRPMVIPVEPSKIYLDTLLQCARSANLDFDELLIGAPVEVAVRPWSFEGRMSPVSGAVNQIHKRLHLMAIRIDTDFMAKRYDELCAKYFTGG